MKKVIALIIVLAVCFSFAGAMPASKNNGNNLVISKDNISHDVSDTLYGAFIEDISYACDGGLVSNLVNNNSFEYESDNFTGWSIDSQSYSVQNKDGLNENNQKFLSVTVDEKATLFNNGFTELYDYKTYTLNEKKRQTADMGFKKNEKYEFSAYLRNVNFEGEISVALKAKGNSKVYTFSIDDFADWTKVIFQIQSDVTADGGLLITANGTGTFHIDFVSLIPANSHGFDSAQWKYVSLRADLFEALADLSPKFIRFPGGCLAEGDSLQNLYNWKNTIGPIEERKQTYNLWRDDNNGRNYINTNAMGYYEYFMLCSDLGAEPIPVVNAGLCCQARNGYGSVREEYRNGALTEEEWQAYLDTIALRPGTEEWDSYVQDILDLIEFANGSSDSKWGSVRAENGRTEPFNMKYLAIGNENWGDVYWRNFDALYKAVKKAYPEITIVTTSGAWLEGEDFDVAWNTANSKYPDTIVDEHYYTVGGFLFGQTGRYDNYERSGAKVFVGEWAPRSDGYGTIETKNNIWSAIEEAAYLTGIEKNADVVKMISYAPTFAKVNAQCWDVNLIWFDSKEVCRTPDYYTQMLFANNLGNKYIATDFNMEEQGIYKSVTVDTENEVLYVKLVNSQMKNVNITLDLQGFENVTTASCQYMSETFKAACNEVGERLHVAPKEQSYEITDNKLTYKAEGLSINVIRIPYGQNDGSALYTLPETEIVTPYIHIVIQIAFPCALGLVLVITTISVLINKHIINKRNQKINAKKENKDKREE